MGTVVHLAKIRQAKQVEEWDRAEEARSFNGTAIVVMAMCVPPGIAFWAFLFWIVGWI